MMRTDTDVSGSGVFRVRIGFEGVNSVEGEGTV